MLILIYILVTLATGGIALWNGATYPGIAGIIGPTMCCMAVSGLKGPLMLGGWGQKIAGFAGASLIVGIGIGIVYHFGFSPELFGHKVSGVIWCLIGLVVGWIGTKRRQAE